MSSEDMLSTIVGVYNTPDTLPNLLDEAVAQLTRAQDELQQSKETETRLKEELQKSQIDLFAAQAGAAQTQEELQALKLRQIENDEKVRKATVAAFAAAAAVKEMQERLEQQEDNAEIDQRLDVKSSAESSAPQEFYQTTRKVAASAETFLSGLTTDQSPSSPGKHLLLSPAHSHLEALFILASLSKASHAIDDQTIPAQSDYVTSYQALLNANFVATAIARLEMIHAIYYRSGKATATLRAMYDAELNAHNLYQNGGMSKRHVRADAGE